MKTTKLIKSAWFFAVLLGFGLGSAQAASITNADAAVNLNLGGSWVGGTPAGSGDVAVWDNTVQLNTTKALGADTSWAGIQILDPAARVTISAGNTLTLGASGIDMSMATNGLTLACPMVLGADQIWNVTNVLNLTNGALTVSGALGASTATTLTKTGNGVLNFSSTANGTYAGAVTVNAGMLIVGGANGNLNSAVGTGAINMNDGATLRTAGKIVGNALVFSGTSTVDANGGSFTLDGAWQGSGTVIITNMISSSTVTAGGNGNGGADMGSFTGTIIVSSTNSDGVTPTAGSFRFNNGGSSPNQGNAAMTLNLGQGSAHFTEKNSGTTANFGAVYGGPNTQLTQPENYHIGALGLDTTFAGTIMGASSLTKEGTGTFTLTGNNTNTSYVTINNGVLQVGDGVTSNQGKLGAGVITLAGGKLLYNKPDNFGVSNAISGSSGSFIKTNAGILTYYGTNNSSVTMIISQGTLALASTGLTNSDGSTNIARTSCPIYLASGTTLDVSQDIAFTNGFILNETLSGFGAVNGFLTAGGLSSTINPGVIGAAGTLTFNNGLAELGSVNNVFWLSTPGSTNDLINVVGDLTLNGTNYINVNFFGAIPTGPGAVIYPLIAYGGTLIGDVTNFTVSVSGASGTLTNITTTTPPEIAVIVAPAPRGATNLTWVGDGAANNWNTTSSNWVSGAASFAFQGGDTVLFNDSGFPNTNVNIAITVQPASVTVDSTNQYFLTGAAGVSGLTGLTKTNSGTLSISATNGYTGATVVRGGTLELFNVANSGSASAIGAASSDPLNLVFYGGTALKYSGGSAATDRGATLNGQGLTVDVRNGANLTVNGVLTGSGALTLVDSGTLTLGNANSYIGGTVISNGTLATANQTANVSGLGTNAVSFYGGTLALYRNNGDDGSTVFSFSNPLIVPAGQTGNLAIFERGNVSSTLTGGGTINVTSIGPRGSLSGNWSAFSGTINVITNSAYTNYANLRIGNPNGYSNAVINLNDFVDLSGGNASGTYSSTPTFDIGELDGTSLSTIGTVSKPSPFPTWRIGWKNTTSVFAGTIANTSCTNSIIKVGTGTLYLLGQNTYVGSTVVSNGVLALSNNPATGFNGSIDSSATITIAAGAAIDVTGRSDKTLTLGSQILQGNGAVRGTLNGGSGMIAPGGGITGGIGTLTVTNNVFMGGTTWMKLNRAATGQTNDQFVSSGSYISYGGTLVVTNTGPTLQVGDKFTLFRAASFSGGIDSFTAVVLPGYYTWDTSQLGVNGSITVTSLLPHPKVKKADFSNLAGGSITFTTTNGIYNTGVNILSSTNLALPLSSWTVVTNTFFDANGNVVDPNTYLPPLVIQVDPTQTPMYYLLQTTGLPGPL